MCTVHWHYTFVCEDMRVICYWVITSKSNTPSTVTSSEIVHTRLLNATITAVDKWKDIGRALGFNDAALTAIVHEPGNSSNKDWYSSMLKQWMDRANSSPEQLVFALRKVGKERLALDVANMEGMLPTVLFIVCL